MQFWFIQIEAYLCLRLPDCQSFVNAPPKKERGAYCFAHVVPLVSRYIGFPYLVQLITQEHFSLEASNLVGE